LREDYLHLFKTANIQNRPLTMRWKLAVLQVVPSLRYPPEAVATTNLASLSLFAACFSLTYTGRAPAILRVLLAFPALYFWYDVGFGKYGYDGEIHISVIDHSSRYSFLARVVRRLKNKSDWFRDGLYGPVRPYANFRYMHRVALGRSPAPMDKIGQAFAHAFDTAGTCAIRDRLVDLGQRDELVKRYGMGLFPYLHPHCPKTKNDQDRMAHKEYYFVNLATSRH
jgi:hypothetical protein